MQGEVLFSTKQAETQAHTVIPHVFTHGKIFRGDDGVEYYYCERDRDSDAIIEVGVAHNVLAKTASAARRIQRAVGSRLYDVTLLGQRLDITLNGYRGMRVTVCPPTKLFPARILPLGVVEIIEGIQYIRLEKVTLDSKEWCPTLLIDRELVRSELEAIVVRNALQAHLKWPDNRTTQVVAVPNSVPLINARTIRIEPAKDMRGKRIPIRMCRHS